MAEPISAAIRGPLLTFTGDPFERGLAATMRHEPDAIVAMAAGRIVAVGPAAEILRTLPPGVAVEEYGADALILAGFVDAHVHYPQTGIIGAHGAQLLDWLERHTFVAEQLFADPAHARVVADAFLDECLRNGVTSAAVFCTVHPASVDAFFAAASARSLRMIAGKVLMDRHAPPALLDTAERGYDESKALIARWHGRGRLGYAITPRFAASSTPAQLDAAGALRREFPDCHLQSHIAENKREVAWIRELFPERAGYLDVYDHHGLLGRRAIYGHGIWLTEDEFRRLHESGTAIAHCPTSNFFLGSGAFDLANAVAPARPVAVALATDLGAGTSFSMLRTMGAAYQAAQLHGHALSAGHAFYLATRGGARALDLEDRIGSVAPGMEADLVVLDLRSTPIIDFRLRRDAALEEKLFVQMTMADDRAVQATWVNGRHAWRRPG